MSYRIGSLADVNLQRPGHHAIRLEASDGVDIDPPTTPSMSSDGYLLSSAREHPGQVCTFPTDMGARQPTLRARGGGYWNNYSRLERSFRVTAELAIEKGIAIEE